MKGREKILLFEEDSRKRGKLERFLSHQTFSLCSTASLSEASERLSGKEGFTLALIGLGELDKRKIDFLRSIRSARPGVGIILLTAMDDPGLSLDLLRRGIVDHVSTQDHLGSVYSAVHSEIQKRQILAENRSARKKLQAVLSNEDRNLRRVIDLEEVYDSTLENLMTALDLRDVETFGHSRTVAKYSRTLADLLKIKNKQTLDNIRKGALLHDVGKIAIPDSILKKPSPLTEEEWEKIRMHPALGYGLIKEIKLLEEAANIILYHHERYDGRGYPHGLKEEEIPLEARIFALADALDAITSYRPYRRQRNFKAAREEIRSHAGSQFDPAVVDAFCSLELSVWERIRFETTRLIPGFEELSKLP